MTVGNQLTTNPDLFRKVVTLILAKELADSFARIAAIFRILAVNICPYPFANHQILTMFAVSK
jgi:hypothetical protein